MLDINVVIEKKDVEEPEKYIETIDTENSKRIIVLRLLLNPLTSKITFNYISNKNYKKFKISISE